MMSEADLRAKYVKLYRNHVRKTEGYDPAGYGANPIPRWDGGEDENGRNYKSVWRWLIDQATQKNIHPRFLVEAAFSAAQGGKPPSPNTLFRPAFIQAYHKYCDKCYQEALRHSAKWLKKAIEELKGLHFVCYGDELTEKISQTFVDNQLTSIDAFLLSHMFGQPALVEAYAPQAREALSFGTPRLEELLANFYPPETLRLLSTLSDQSKTAN